MTPAALWTAAVVTAAAILSLDLLLPLGAAGAVLYVLLVLLALKSPSRNTAFGLAVAGSVLTVLGFFLSEPRAMLSVALTNRALALFAIWISVLPVVRYQRIRFGGMKNRIDVEDIMNSVMEAIIISDERGIMLAVNKSAEAMFGYKAKELIGKSAAILRPEPERTQYQKRIDEFDRTGRGLFVDQGIHQERRLRKDGSIFPMEMHVGELWRNGRRLFVGTTRDVSARQKAEDKQCQTQELFEKAFQGAPLMMCLTNLENHMYLDVNDAWLKGVGQSREKIIGQTSVEFPLWVSETQRAKAHKELKETGSLRGFEAKWRRTDNSIFDVRIQAERLDIDGKPAILSIARDVTKETRAEQALRLSEARFRDVAEIASDWIWETDANNRISYISDRVRDALGFDPKVVIGSVRGMSDRIADKGSKAWQRHLKDVEARRPFRNFVYQHYHHEGGIRHIQISGKPVFGEDGEFMGYRGVGSDITRQREIEMARARAKQQRERARQRLQAVMDNVLEGIVTIDEGGLIETINPAGEELFGYTADDVVGRNVSILMSAGHGHKHDGYLAHYFRTGERRILRKPRELMARHRDGSEFPIESSGQ